MGHSTRICSGPRETAATSLSVMLPGKPSGKIAKTLRHGWLVQKQGNSISVPVKVRSSDRLRACRASILTGVGIRVSS